MYGVGLIIDKQLFDDLVKVRRKVDMVLIVKFILGRESLNFINVYAQQIALNKSNKRQFC